MIFDFLHSQVLLLKSAAKLYVED